MADNYLDEDVLIGEAPQTNAESEPMDVVALQGLFQDMGRDVLTEQEYMLLQAQQMQKDFRPGAWHENLADRVDQSELNLIAQDIWRWVQWDEESRAGWSAREQAGIRMMGVTDDAELPEEGLRFDGMATVVHPGFAEACVQFQARAITELFPPEGPVKTVVLGQSDEQTEAQAERVQSFMNYQYTRLMPGAYEEEARLLLRLPLSGSVFKKVYFDPEEETAMSIMVEPSDFLVPYSANDLRSSPRYTHRMWVAEHIIKSRMQSGFYRDVKLVFATEANYPETRRVIEDSEGREPTMFMEDRRHCLLETHCYRHIKSLHQQEGGVGDETHAVPLPWVITMDRDSQLILSIRRNWREGDSKHKKRIWFVHKRFLPGLGFYGYGFAHLIGNLSRTQTGALRGILDSAGIDNRRGGFIAADARMKLDKPLGMGEWRQVEATAEELSKCFFPIPRNQSNDLLIKMLGYLDEAQQRFGATTEVQVGDANNNAPVGTTLALIEQGQKVSTAIHQGLHNANAEEFRILAELDKEFMPEVYPYKIAGEEKEVMAADFDDRIDIIPVSDPRLATNTQRIAQQQAILQLATQAPNLYDLRVIHRRMLETLRVQDIDSLLPDIEPKRMEPVEEGMAIMVNKPIRVFPDQDHAAHILVHDTWFNHLPPPYQQQYQAIYLTHRAEHMAWQWRLQMEQAMGVGLPYPKVMTNDADEDTEELPPEMEQALSVRAAQAVQVLAMQQNMADQQQALQQQAVNQQQAMVQYQAAQDQHYAKQQQDDEAFRREQARLDEETRREIERNNAIAQAEREQASADSEAERIRQQQEQVEP